MYRSEEEAESLRCVDNCCCMGPSVIVNTLFESSLLELSLFSFAQKPEGKCAYMDTVKNVEILTEK